jgi:3alpha(or 20beta)-hydroxysteroid dehydrogenase
MGRVSGKVALVTGAAQGMGAAFVRKLADEGASVLATDIRDEQGTALADELGDRVRFAHHDVTRADDWARSVATAEEEFGPVSVLVNNAGIVTYAPIEALEESELRHTIDVNLISVALGMKAVLASMRRAQGGAIINVSSAAGLVGNDNIAAYTASKFGVRGITKVAALEFAPYGIRVNSIHPGLILTPMTEGAAGDNDTVAAVTAAVPAARFGLPDEVASIVLLLASDEAGFSTGSEFVIDGGLTCR